MDWRARIIHSLIAAPTRHFPRRERVQQQVQVSREEPRGREKQANSVPIAQRTLHIAPPLFELHSPIAIYAPRMKTIYNDGDAKVARAT